MARRPRTRDDGRNRRLVVCCALLAAASSVARAQPCTAALPAAASAADNGGKFRLIAQQCPGLAETAQAHHAAQLDLYDRQPSIAIAMPIAMPLGAAAAPPDRDAARVLSLAPALAAAARAHDIDPLLLHAIAHVESRHNTRAVSPAGARGVMQVMPATALRFGVGDPERALFDAEINLRASAAYLRTLRSRYGDDLKLMLAAYNAGEGAVDKHGGVVPPYPETQAYVRDVLAVYRRLSASFAVSASGALVARGAQP
jgi:soluble lytic murein transglycosylase-like protein